MPLETGGDTGATTTSMSGKPHGQLGDTMSPAGINFALPYCRYWRNCRCYGGTMGSRSNLVLIPSADGRESWYWRTGSAIRWSCRHGEQALPHSSTSCNMRAQDASPSSKNSTIFFSHTREGGSLHFTDRTQSQSIEAKGKKITREFSGECMCVGGADQPWECQYVACEHAAEVGCGPSRSYSPLLRRVQTATHVCGE